MSLEFSQSYHLNKTVSAGPLSVYLYEDNLESSWQQSYDNCVNEGQRFVIIDNAETQTLVEKLLKDLPTSQNDQVWTAGRGSGDDTWKYMNWTKYPNPGIYLLPYFHVSTLGAHMIQTKQKIFQIYLFVIFHCICMCS